MRTKIKRWVNGLALRIPMRLAIEAQLREGTEVNLAVIQRTLLVAPSIKRSRSPTLKALLRRVTKRNLHGEVRVETAEGREFW